MVTIASGMTAVTKVIQWLVTSDDLPRLKIPQERFGLGVDSYVPCFVNSLAGTTWCLEFKVSECDLKPSPHRALVDVIDRCVFDAAKSSSHIPEIDLS